MKHAQKWVFFFSIVVAGILSYQLYQSNQNAAPEDVKAAYLPGGDFELERNGEVFSTQQLRGAPYVLYFGFTTCPDVCPLGLTVIRDALKSDPSLQTVPAVFVSLDPERDTSEVMQAYLEFFHPNIIGLRGDLVTTHAVAKQYGTYFIKAPLPSGSSDDPSQYTIDHTAYYFVIDADGKLKRVLEHNAKPEDLAAALMPLL